MFPYNIASSIVFIAASIYIIVESATFPQADGGGADAAYWPSFLGWVILFLSVALLLDTLFKRFLAKSRAADPAPFDFKSRGMLYVYGLCGIFAVFSALMHYVNFTVASVFLIPACMRLMGEKRLIMLASITAGIPILIWVIFAKILGILLP